MRTISVALAATLLMAGTALAVPITILNNSFESPALGLGGFSPPVTSWTITGTTGVWHPLGSQLSQGPTDLLQVAYSNGGTLIQALSATLTANTQYTLDVDLLSRSDGLVNFSSTLELLAGNNVLASSIIHGGVAGTNVLQEVSFFAASNNAFLGQQLGIELISGGGQSDWDNVRLDATTRITLNPTPEPASLALLSLGLAGLGFIRRRKQKAA